MIRSLFIIILFFPIFLNAQCLEGDCENDIGIKQTEIRKYVGKFSNGQFISGEVYLVEYNEIGENLYSKKERLEYKGEFENGRIIIGKSYDENEELIFDGEYSYSDGYRYFSQGKWYADKQIIYDGHFLNGAPHGKGMMFNNGIKSLEGKFLNGKFIEGKTFDENEKLIYDGQYKNIDNSRYRHGLGILYEDGEEYKIKYNKGVIVANEYLSDDIVGVDEFTEINLISSADYGSNELINIFINGNKLTYTFDTGAEGFDIPPSLEKKLIEKGLIDKSDYYPPIISVDANNNKKKLRRVKISNIKIGDYVVNNVVATINNRDDDPLLLGRDLFQRKFRDYTLKPGSLILYK